MLRKNQKGFTLVEVAIVLVIVGLLIGGVLKGREMITNAKLKRIEGDHTSISAAMFSYQDRYLQLPGDDSGASDRFSVYAAADPVNGDGTGTIDGAWDATASADITATQQPETNLFYAHLRAAGFLPGSGTDDTKLTHAYGGHIGVQNSSLGISGHVTVFSAMDGAVVRILESRLDDSAPDSGRIQLNVSGSGMAGSATTADTAVTTLSDDQQYDMAFRL